MGLRDLKGGNAASAQTLVLSVPVLDIGEVY